MTYTKLPISDLIPILEVYNEQETRFCVPADIFAHCSQIVPLRVAIVMLTELEKYYNKQEISTVFFIWHEENLKVWNDIKFEYEFKHVVKISADNDKIKEFAIKIDSSSD